MAKTIILYPTSDIQLEHTKSNSNAAGGYVLINDITPDDSDGYIRQSLSSSSSGSTSTSIFLCSAETGKIYITGVSTLFRAFAYQSANSIELSSSITPSVSINNGNFASGSKHNLTVNTNTTWYNYTDNIENVPGLNTIYQSVADANIKLQLYQPTSASGSGGKYSSAETGITQANVTITYLDVFDCAAELIPGTGIASVNCSSSEVVDGNTCTFTATLENNIEFVGWFSDEQGENLVSTDRVYTTTISENTVLYAKGSVLYNVDARADENCTVNVSQSSVLYGTSVTVTAIPNSSRYSFVGWYSNPERTNLINESNPYIFDVHNDVVLYAKTKINQQLYVKINEVWIAFSKAYKKINGEWIEQTDLSGVFDTNKKYVKKDI